MQRDVKITSDRYRFCGQHYCLVLETHLCLFVAAATNASDTLKTIKYAKMITEIRQDVYIYLIL